MLASASADRKCVELQHPRAFRWIESHDANLPREASEMPSRPLRDPWLIDPVCFDGSPHGGGRPFGNSLPAFDPERTRVFPYFPRSSDEC